MKSDAGTINDERIPRQRPQKMPRQLRDAIVKALASYSEMLEEGKLDELEVMCDTPPNAKTWWDATVGVSPNKVRVARFGGKRQGVWVDVEGEMVGPFVLKAAVSDPMEQFMKAHKKAVRAGHASLEQRVIEAYVTHHLKSSEES